MILARMYYLEEETKKNIRKEQQKRDSWEIDEREYEEKYEAIMDNFRLMTQIILNL